MKKKRNRENFLPDKCKGDGRVMAGVKKEKCSLRQLGPGRSLLPQAPNQ